MYKILLCLQGLTTFTLPVQVGEVSTLLFDLDDLNPEFIVCSLLYACLLNSFEFLLDNA